MRGQTFTLTEYRPHRVIYATKQAFDPFRHFAPCGNVMRPGPCLLARSAEESRAHPRPPRACADLEKRRAFQEQFEADVRKLDKPLTEATRLLHEIDVVLERIKRLR